MTSASEPEPAPGNSRAFLCLVGLVLLAGVCLLAFSLLRSPRRTGGVAAIGALKAISNAQILYREGDKDGDGTLNYAPSLAALTNTGTSGDEDLIDEVLASGTKQGYVFAITSVSQTGWTVNANPAEPGVTGDRYFGANMEGQIFFSSEGPIRWNQDGTSPDPLLGD